MLNNRIFRIKSNEANAEKIMDAYVNFSNQSTFIDLKNQNPISNKKARNKLNIVLWEKMVSEILPRPWKTNENIFNKVRDNIQENVAAMASADEPTHQTPMP